MNLTKKMTDSERMTFPGVTVLPAQAGWHAVYWMSLMEEDRSEHPVLELRPILGWVVDLTGPDDEVSPITLASYDRTEILDGAGIADTSQQARFLGFMPPQETLSDHGDIWRSMAADAWERSRLARTQAKQG